MIKYEEKKNWVLQWIDGRGFSTMKYASTFDAEFHDAFHLKFGDKLLVYTIGPNRCPSANRLLRRMWEEGELVRATSGNQEAKQYCQPNWSHTYRLRESNVGETYEAWYKRVKCKPIRFRRNRRRV